MLPFRPAVFQLAGVVGHVARASFALEFVSSAFLVPLLVSDRGAVQPVRPPFAMLKRSPGRVCGSCSGCSTVCRMGALDGGRFSPEACNLCMDCVEVAEKKSLDSRLAKERLERSWARDRSISRRRTALIGIAGGGGHAGRRGGVPMRSARQRRILICCGRPAPPMKRHS